MSFRQNILFLAAIVVYAVVASIALACASRSLMLFTKFVSSQDLENAIEYKKNLTVINDDDDDAISSSFSFICMYIFTLLTAICITLLLVGLVAY